MPDDVEARKKKEDEFFVPLLLAMTVVTGAVDAVSILRLGRVFVANMTGNVVFLGFALARTPGFSVPASLVALAAFLVGAGGGARVFGTVSPRPRLLGRVAATEAALFATATVLTICASGSTIRYAMTVVLAMAMGLRNATVRRLGVADLTTTVLTLTLTGLAADEPHLRGPNPATRRRLLAVVCMLAGAVGGALLVIHASTGWALGVATAVLLAVTAVAMSKGEEKA
jgi:uncharacterized membrane protein YoaK (UPF0700 family)